MPKKEPGAEAGQEEGGADSLFESKVEELLAGTALDINALGRGLQDLVLELFKLRPKPWDAMLQDEQRSVARSTRLAIDEFLAEACLLIAAQGQHQIVARLEKFVGKGGKYQVALALQGGPELAMDLAKLDGKTVLIVDADSRPYEGSAPDPSQSDQPPLEFDEEPLPPHDEQTGELLEEEGEEQSEAEEAEAAQPA